MLSLPAPVPISSGLTRGSHSQWDARIKSAHDEWWYSLPHREQGLGQLDKTRSAFARCDKGGSGRNAVEKRPHIGHTDAVGKITEHRCVIRAVAGKDGLPAHRIEIGAEAFGKQHARHGKLVPIPEPADDMHRTHLRTPKEPRVLNARAQRRISRGQRDN